MLLPTGFAAKYILLPIDTELLHNDVTQYHLERLGWQVGKRRCSFSNNYHVRRRYL